MPPSPVTNAELAILRSSFNLRDIGGVLTGDGRRVRRGMLFRSGEPRRLDQPAAAAFHALGLAHVCDMRADNERFHRPVEHPGYLATKRFTRNIAASNADLWARLEEEAVRFDEVYQTMVEVYRRLPGEQGPALGAMVAALAEGQAPLLFHCAAGKDRTGFAAGILLATLGVPDEAIIADYVQTEPWMSGQRERFLRKKRDEGAEAGIWQPLFACEPDFLLTALGIVRSAPGGLEGWLASQGLTAAEIAAARGHLLEEA